MTLAQWLRRAADGFIGNVAARRAKLLEAADALLSHEDGAVAYRDRIADLERELAETKQRDLLALNELHDAHQAAEAKVAALERELAAMTENRDNWRAACNESDHAQEKP